MDNAENSNLNFQIGQHIVYPMQGVGYIKGVEERIFCGEPTPYFVIDLPGTEMMVMVPCSKISDLGIRPVVSKEAAQSALDQLKEPLEFDEFSDWKQRYQVNMDLAKTGKIDDVASVVSFLYTRSKRKELPILERKLYDTVRSLFVDELHFALDLPKNEIENRIQIYLESNIDESDLIPPRITPLINDEAEVESLSAEADDGDDNEDDDES